MPAGLRFFKRDPNGKGRGRGIYYHRGNGVYSKYNIERDRKIRAKGWRTSKVGIPRKSSLLHTGDGKRPR